GGGPGAPSVSRRGRMVVRATTAASRWWRIPPGRPGPSPPPPPLAETRRRLRRDPGNIVPLIDAGLAAIDAGRTAAAVDAIQRILRLAGDTQTGPAPATRKSPATKGTRR